MLGSKVKAVNNLCVLGEKNSDGMQITSYLFGKWKDFYLYFLMKSSHDQTEVTNQTTNQMFSGQSSTNHITRLACIFQMLGTKDTNKKKSKLLCSFIMLLLQMWM